VIKESLNRLVVNLRDQTPTPEIHHLSDTPMGILGFWLAILLRRFG
jgi:hypothetical protein